MKIALCVKQVPDTSKIKWTENNTMQREGVESILNPYDVYAAECALKLKSEYCAEITAFSMGPNQAKEMLKNLIAIGIDKSILISDKKFAGSDTYATGKTVSKTIEKVLPDFDMIICGQFAIDGDTAQTGPCIAGILGLPQVTYVKHVDKIENGYAEVTRELDDGTELVKVKLPAVLCVLQDTYEPTRAKINDIIKAQNSEIQTVSIDDIDISADEAGLKGSPTFVSKAFRPETKHNTQKYFENGAEVILNKIKEVLSE